MIAYKFLRTGRIGPFSRFAWPAPPAWVDCGCTLEPCRRGIHACRTQDLPWWLADELWVIELAGAVESGDHKIMATTGRLSRRVVAWTHACAHEYAEQCAWRARDRAAQALTRAGRARAATELSSCATLVETIAVARRTAVKAPETRISLTISADSALRALFGPPASAAYIAAHAARMIDGPAGYAAERAWQSRWLVERLGLK